VDLVVELVEAQHQIALRQLAAPFGAVVRSQISPQRIQHLPDVAGLGFHPLCWVLRALAFVHLFILFFIAKSLFMIYFICVSFYLFPLLFLSSGCLEKFAKSFTLSKFQHEPDGGQLGDTCFPLLSGL
jgi:hypothetical protein